MILEVFYMKGMKGVIVEIDFVEKIIVYMVDYILIMSGEKVKNYKWVIEDEFLVK